MREFATGFGPHIVNHTIILGIEKRARHALQNVIVVFVNPQILIDKLLRLLPEMLGDTFYIGSSEKRPGRFAAIGALQAIGFAEFRIVQFLHRIIEVFGRLFFELIEILFVFVMLIFGKLRKLIERWFHAAKLQIEY